MKRATSATVCSNNASSQRNRVRSSVDVNRWVEMIGSELRSEDTTDQDTDQDGGESVTVTLEFGRSTIDLANQPLKLGESLRLDQLADEPLDVVVDGRPIARGELVEVDGQLGVRIIELLMFLVAWIALGTSPGLAQERSGAFLFDNESERLETPFGTVRGSRTTRETDNNSSAAPAKLFDEPSEQPTTPLPRRSDAARREANPPQGNATTGWSATVWPLLFVVGLIIVGARWLKSRTPSAARGLPGEVFEVLGRNVLDPRTAILLARCGSRLLVLSSSPHGLRTLAEIADPVEVDCLAGLCRATPRDQSLVETFRSLLHKPSGLKPTTPMPTNSILSNSLDERLSTRLSSPRPVSPTSLPEVRT